MRRRRCCVYNSDDQLYQCRNCSTYITREIDYIRPCSGYASEGGQYLEGGLFTNASNVHSSIARNSNAHLVEEIFCDTCHIRLGWRFVRVSQAYVNFICSGDFLLNMNRLRIVMVPQVTVTYEEEGEQAGPRHELLLDGEEEDGESDVDNNDVSEEEDEDEDEDEYEDDDVILLEPQEMEEEDEQRHDTDQEQEELAEQMVQNDEQAPPQDQEHAGQPQGEQAAWHDHEQAGQHQGEQAAGQDQEQVRQHQGEQAAGQDQHHFDGEDGEHTAGKDHVNLADADFFNDFPDDFDDDDIN